MVEKLNEADGFIINDREVQSMDEFCNLSSLITAHSNCDKEVKISIGRQMLRLENLKRYGSTTQQYED